MLYFDIAHAAYYCNLGVFTVNKWIYANWRELRRSIGLVLRGFDNKHLGKEEGNHPFLFLRVYEGSSRCPGVSWCFHTGHVCIPCVETQDQKAGASFFC